MKTIKTFSMVAMLLLLVAGCGDTHVAPPGSTIEFVPSSWTVKQGIPGETTFLVFEVLIRDPDGNLVNEAEFTIDDGDNGVIRDIDGNVIPRFTTLRTGANGVAVLTLEVTIGVESTGGVGAVMPPTNAVLDVTVEASTAAEDNDGDGFTPLELDCNDADPTVYPGATELLDGIDNDCDGFVDEQS